MRSTVAAALKATFLNSIFLTGAGCIVGSAFMVALPLGLFVLGCPLVALALHIQLKSNKVKVKL